MNASKKNDFKYYFVVKTGTSGMRLLSKFIRSRSRIKNKFVFLLLPLLFAPFFNIGPKNQKETNKK